MVKLYCLQALSCPKMLHDLSDSTFLKKICCVPSDIVVQQGVQPENLENLEISRNLKASQKSREKVKEFI